MHVAKAKHPEKYRLDAKITGAIFKEFKSISARKRGTKRVSPIHRPAQDARFDSFSAQALRRMLRAGRLRADG